MKPLRAGPAESVLELNCRPPAALDRGLWVATEHPARFHAPRRWLADPEGKTWPARLRRAHQPPAFEPARFVPASIHQENHSYRWSGT